MEEPIPGAYTTMGYGLSKLVGERICETAAHDSGLPVTIIRAGQLSFVAFSNYILPRVLILIGSGSSKNGTWAPSEIVPIILRSSISLGSVPDDLPVSVCLQMSLLFINHSK